MPVIHCKKCNARINHDSEHCCYCYAPNPPPEGLLPSWRCGNCDRPIFMDLAGCPSCGKLRAVANPPVQQKAPAASPPYLDRKPPTPMTSGEQVITILFWAAAVGACIFGARAGCNLGKLSDDEYQRYQRQEYYETRYPR